MRALSIQQPWAWAIVHGPKRIENRTWGTSYRGPLLIHAGRSRERLGDYGTGEPDASEMAFGAIIGIVTLWDCVTLDRLHPELRADQFAEGPWCWLLKDPQAFETPIPLKGQMGLWSPPKDLRLPEIALS